MIHYHGTPLTPRAALLTMAGKHFCVPFSDPRDADTCQAIAQSIMFDSGAFSAFRGGREVEWSAYYTFLEPRLGHPHWAVVPDVIDGDTAAQEALVAGWPFPQALGAPVWHLGLPIDYLLHLAGDGWPKLCFGSSAQYWQVGSAEWCRRVDEAFTALAKRYHYLPHIHMLRGLAMAGDRWPFASADSVNVARNYKDTSADPERMARRIDAVQCPVRWVGDVQKMKDFFA